MSFMEMGAFYTAEQGIVLEEILIIFSRSWVALQDLILEFF
jgi:hypothetical protein